MKKLAYAAIAAVAVLAASCAANGAAEPAITSFVFAASSAENAAAGVGADIVATIDEGTRIITARMPSAISSYASLSPSIVAADGSVVSPTPATARDFSNSPVTYVATNADGDAKVYFVIVQAAVAQAAADAVLFTEYYAGTGYGYKGDRNQYIELTNRSASSVDLSQYALKRCYCDSGVRDASRDIVTRLKGSLAAGASIVIYANRLNLTRYTTIASLPSARKLDDQAFNYVVDFDGDDGYQLLRDGTVLDCIGPAGGGGDGSLWGREKLMQRKLGAEPSPAWDDKQWVMYEITRTNADAANAGADSAAIADDDTRLTYFAFEGIRPPSYGLIDESTHSVAISVPEGTSLKALAPSLSTMGLGVTYGLTRVVSGATALDFSSPLSLVVWPTLGATTQAYTVTVSTYLPMAYTTTNYAFSGGIGAIVATIKAGSPGSVKTLSGTIEGILTGKDIVYKIGSEYSTCFTIQDKDAGVLVYSSVGVDLPLGSRIRFPVTQGMYNYSMQCITAHGAVTRVDPGIYNIYYKTGHYATNADVGFVFSYTGTIRTAPDSYNEGLFTAADMYQTNDLMTPFMKEGLSGSFYGPVLVSYSKYKVTITCQEQILP